MANRRHTQSKNREKLRNEAHSSDDMVDIDDIKVAKQYADEWKKYLRDRLKLEKEIRDNQKQLNSMLKVGLQDTIEYQKILHEKKGLLEQHEKLENNINWLAQDTGLHFGEHNEMLREQTKQLDEQVVRLREFSQEARDRFKVDDAIYNITRLRGSLIEKEVKMADDLTGSSAVALQMFDKTNTVLNSMSDTTYEVADIMQRVNDLGFSELDNDRTMETIAENMQDMDALSLDIERNKAMLTEEQYNQLKDTLDVTKSITGEYEKQIKAAHKAHEGAESFMGGIDSAFDRINEKVMEIPGGEFLAKHLHLDEMESSIKTKLGESLSKSFMSGAEGGAGMFKSLAMGAKSFGMALMTGPQAIILGIVAVGALLVSMFMEADEEVANIGTSLGVSYKQASNLYDASIGLSNQMNLTGVAAKEVVETLGEMNNELPGITQAFIAGNEHAKEIAKSATVLSTKFGLSGEEVSNLASMAVITHDTLDNMSSTVGEMGTKTIGTKEAMKAMASVPKSVTAAFKGSNVELAKAAIKAHALGVSLGKVQEVGDDMLDIESSLGKEMEARVITGRDLNFDRARELALQGDIAGLQDELLTQAGSLSQFTSMNRLGQQAMADAMNMTVDEMTEMLSRAEELHEIGMSQEELDKASAEALAERAKHASGHAKDTLLRLAAEKESASVQEKFASVMDKIKQTAMKLITPILDMVNGFFEMEHGTEGVGNSLNAIGDVLSTITKVIIALAKPIIKFIVAPLTAAWGIVDGLIKMFTGDFKGGLEEIGQSLVGWFLRMPEMIMTAITGVIDAIFGTHLTEAVSGMFDTLKKLGGEILSWMSPIFEGLVAGLSPLWDMLKDIGSAISDMFSMFGPMTSDLFGPAEDGATDFASTLKSIGDTVRPIMKGIGQFIGDYILLPMKGLIGMWHGVVTMMRGDFVGGLKEVGSSLMKTLFAPFIAIWNAIERIVGDEGLGAVKDTVMSIGSTIVDVWLWPFKAIQSAIESVIGFLTNIGTTVMNVMKDMLPDWAKWTLKTVFGIDVDGASAGAEQKSESMKSTAAPSDSKQVAAMPAMAAGGTVASSGVAVVGEQGPEVVALPQGATVINNNQSQQIANTIGQGQQGNDGQKLDQVINLLSQIVQQTSTPAQIRIGDKVINEMGTIMKMRKSATLGLDNNYGITH